MSWPGFYALSNAWWFLLLIPLIVLYFLKLKRPRHEIPSLALWNQVINDQRVNSPFQKFKRNMLLLLQTLLLCLLALAAMQPFMRGAAERADYLPILVDCSASMAARKEADGETRLEVAKREIGQLIDDMLPDQQMSLISVTNSARRLTDFTNNKRILREALGKLEVNDVAGKLEDALRMTQALSRTVPIDTVFVYSDGNFPAQVNFELPFELNFQQIPAGGTNLGIMEFNARRAKASEWDVFVRVGVSRDADGEAAAELYQDGELIAEETVILDTDETQRLVFRVNAEQASSLELKLKPDGFDSLESDNVAFLELPEGRKLSVFCPPELPTWRHALRMIETIDLSTESDPTLATYDVVVTDRVEDLDVEARLVVQVGMVPPDLTSLVTVEPGAAKIVDWDRSEPLLQHVNVGAVATAEKPKTAENISDADFESLGYEVLAHSATGPLLLKRREGPRLSFHYLFHTNKSTLPYNIGFPVMVANVIQNALEQASLSELRGQKTGVLERRVVDKDKSFRVEEPDGNVRDYNSGADGILSGIAAPKIGRYRISEGGSLMANVGVGLLDPLESTLEAADEIEFQELSVSAAEETIENDRPLWPILAMLAFAVLLVEWWFFQRRPSGVPAAE